MRRRRFLASVGTLAGVGGCLGDRSTDGSTPSPTETEASPEPTATPTAQPTTAPPTPGEPAGHVVFHAAYRHVVNVDGIAVKTPENAQFAFVSPPPGTDEPLDEIALDVGGQTFEPESFEYRYGEWTPGIEGVYQEGDRTGVVPFDAPTVDAESAALVVDGTRHPIPEESVSGFATAPDLVLESVLAPETAPPNDTVELGVEVRNEGDAEGVYLAGFRISGMPKTIEVPLEPGERDSRTVEYETRGPDRGMTFHFSSPDRDDSYTVDIESKE